MSDLREFLVSLGYEAGSPKEWDAAINRAGKLVAEIAKALGAASAALGAVIEKTTVSLESAHWAAARAGTSAAGLSSLAYAMQQTGRSGDDARSAISAFAARLRTNPSAEGIIRSLGVQTRVNGVMRDNMDLFIESMAALNRNPNYVRAYSTAEQLGISEKDYAHFRRNGDQMLAYMAEMDAGARAMGVDRNAGAAQSAVLMQGWRSAQMQLSIAVDVLVAAVAPILTPLVDRLDAWIKANAGEITRWAHDFVVLAGTLGAWLAKVVQDLAPLATSFAEVIRHGTGADGLTVILEAVGAVWLAILAARLLGAGWKVRAGLVAMVAAFATGRYVAPALFGTGDGQVPGGGGNGGGGATDAPRGFFGRAVDRVKGALGMGGPARNSGAGSAESGPPLDRTTFEEELKDPKVRARLLSLTEAEVGSQGADAQQAFMETIFNRAKARGQTLWQTMHGSYFPASTHANTAARMGDPRLEAKYKDIYDRVYGGSNITNGATGNASGSVGFGGGPETKRFGGEKFGVERQDLGWWQRMIREQEEAARERAARQDAPRPYVPSIWERRSDLFSPSPLIGGESDGFSVETKRTTKIIVHGDPDPHKTAVAVGTEQKRINADIVTTTERAFA